MIAPVVFILTFAGVTAMSSLDSSLTPPFLQSKYAFAHAKTYLEKQLPQETGKIDPEASVHFAFGIVAKVVGELTKAVRPRQPPQRYEPLKILHECLKEMTTWEEYNQIAESTRDLLSEAFIKVRPIIKIIDFQCASTTSAVTCNRKIDLIFKMCDNDIKKRAKLLLQLGIVSKHINDYSNILNVIAAADDMVPYLSHHVTDPTVKHVMKDFDATYCLLRQIPYY